MIAADHEGQRTLGEILLTTLQVASTVANRKQILRLIILDEKLSPGQVWHRIVWQTGAISEHRLPAVRPHILRLHRSRPTAADHESERCRQDGQGDRGRGELRGLHIAARGCPFKVNV